ncbi:hypothetical protein ACRE_065180 [Hapsidospora chrysogenum ATCC 11550]|uniref:Uncharacterized protein n=1 Tax=Hapsidospora chrysogenum (strain ATCC 11550 / CBS 779.69 / DSM 880 / IAM 14645 / JCM 23072 / IMI 49137) TaxID=857340 RepID=A0A086T045_HAPC1|nr:hypothetical protein ACRE_065180 [Hapsidospora chrysogenum ATCC 11550]
MQKEGGEDEWEVLATIYRGGAARGADTQGDDTVVASGGRLGIWTTVGRMVCRLPAVAQFFGPSLSSWLARRMSWFPRWMRLVDKAEEPLGGPVETVAHVGGANLESNAEDVLGWPRIPALGVPRLSWTSRGCSIASMT